MTASVVLPPAGAAGQTAPPSGRRRERRTAVVPANRGDHPSIRRFLTAVFQGPPQGEFRLSLEDPFYEPHDRLLIKRGSQIIAHVRVAHRVMQFGLQALPVGWLNLLGTLPGHRRQGHGHRLLTAAEKHLALGGALIGLKWTRLPHFFRRTGWALCGRTSYSRADTRDVLSGLTARGLLRRGRRRLNIRPWRRVELAALLRTYDQSFGGMFGPLQRSEAYWEWLIRRRGYDQICVALDGPDLLELGEANAPIVGYVVTRGERIVELATAPGYPTVAAHLLARACHDAIEHGRHSLRLDAPPNSRIAKLFHNAGGKRCREQIDQDEVLMAKLLDPVKLLHALADEFCHRARAAGLTLPVELGLLVDGKKYRLAIAEGAADVSSGNIGRSYLRMNVPEFTRLVLGQVDWDRTISEGRVGASTNIAMTAGRALFPRLPLWHPPLDHLPARK